MPRFSPSGLGWLRALPDYRDFSPQTPAVRELLAGLPDSSPHDERPTEVDLRPYFPEVYDQEGLNCSPAQACIALVEYYERRAHGRMMHPSRLFLYQTARKLLHLSGDSGTDLRTTLKALVCFGLPPERLWPYESERLDAAPDAFLYSFALPYRELCYVRLDPRNGTGRATLEQVKNFLAAGFPVAFGFPVPNSMTDEADIPYRPTFDSSHGGQSVVAVGYDDSYLSTTRGALRIRSSWGSSWGDDGYGWLPYAYVEEQLAVEFWTLLRRDWLESGEFEQPRDLPAAHAPHFPQSAH